MRRKYNSDDKGDYFFNNEITGGKKPPIPPLPPPPDDDIAMDDDDYDDDDFDIDDMEPCWMFETISALVTMDKPFGILFNIEKVKKFLELRGYVVGEKHFSHIGDDVVVAIKGGDLADIKDTPEDAAKNHIRKVFNEEIQDILLNWLNRL